MKFNYIILIVITTCLIACSNNITKQPESNNYNVIDKVNKINNLGAIPPSLTLTV